MGEWIADLSDKHSGEVRGTLLKKAMEKEYYARMPKCVYCQNPVENCECPEIFSTEDRETSFALDNDEEFDPIAQEREERREK
jgi:hypothetical protein